MAAPRIESPLQRPTRPIKPARVPRPAASFKEKIRQLKTTVLNAIRTPINRDITLPEIGLVPREAAMLLLAELSRMEERPIEREKKPAAELSLKKVFENLQREKIQLARNFSSQIEALPDRPSQPMAIPIEQKINSALIFVQLTGLRPYQVLSNPVKIRRAIAIGNLVLNPQLPQFFRQLIVRDLSTNNKEILAACKTPEAAKHILVGLRVATAARLPLTSMPLFISRSQNPYVIARRLGQSIAPSTAKKNLIPLISTSIGARIVLASLKQIKEADKFYAAAVFFAVKIIERKKTPEISLKLLAAIVKMIVQEQKTGPQNTEQQIAVREKEKIKASIKLFVSQQTNYFKQTSQLILDIILRFVFSILRKSQASLNIFQTLVLPIEIPHFLTLAIQQIRAAAKPMETSEQALEEKTAKVAKEKRSADPSTPQIQLTQEKIILISILTSIIQYSNPEKTSPEKIQDMIRQIASAQNRGELAVVLAKIANILKGTNNTFFNEVEAGFREMIPILAVKSILHELEIEHSVVLQALTADPLIWGAVKSAIEKNNIGAVADLISALINEARKNRKKLNKINDVKECLKEIPSELFSQLNASDNI